MTERWVLNASPLIVLARVGQEHLLRALSDPCDAVIVTGKGHERSMCFGTTEYPWSDREVLEEEPQDLGYEC